MCVKTFAIKYILVIYTYVRMYKFRQGRLYALEKWGMEDVSFYFYINGIFQKHSKAEYINGVTMFFVLNDEEKALKGKTGFFRKRTWKLNPPRRLLSTAWLSTNIIGKWKQFCRYQNANGWAVTTTFERTLKIIIVIIILRSIIWNIFQEQFNFFLTQSFLPNREKNFL